MGYGFRLVVVVVVVMCVCVCVCVCVCFLLVVAWFLWPMSGGIWCFVCLCVCVCVFFLLVVLVGGFGGFFNGFASWHSGGVVVVAGWCLVG